MGRPKNRHRKRRLVGEYEEDKEENQEETE